jgi:hypothetical protein
MTNRLDRCGFTLAEILVSVLIFTVVSLAMITILLTSTNLFRAGEYGRVSTDEAVAALGTLDDDLRRMVPARDGGFFLAQLHPDGGSPNGNCVVAFVISQPESTAVGKQGEAARQLVMYWVEQDPSTKEDCLVRILAPLAAEYGKASVATQYDVVQDVFTTAPTPPAIARRCLHFAAWISTDLEPRLDAADWEHDAAGNQLRPTTGASSFYCTEAAGRASGPDPFPTAVRFTLALAGGRYAPTGYVIEDTASSIRVAGLSSLPSSQGSLLRIEDEWIRYTGVSGGAIQLDANSRHALRSTQVAHPRNAKVMLAQLYSLARIFPH